MTETALNQRDDDAMVTDVQAGNGSALGSLVAEVTTIGANVIAFVGPPERL